METEEKQGKIQRGRKKKERKTKEQKNLEEVRNIIYIIVSPKKTSL